jgi:hypothetical protein
MVAALPFLAPARDEARRLMVGLLAGIVVVCAPVALFSLVTRGRLSYSGKGYLYGVVSDADIMENGFDHVPLSPLAFVAADPGFVAGAIWSVTTLYARSVFLEREWLAPLMLGWPGALAALVRRQYPRAAGFALVAAAVNFVFYALTWSSWQDRFMLPTVFLLLPFVVDGLFRAVDAVFARLLAGPDRAPLARAASAVAVGAVVAAVMVAWSPRFLEQYQGHFTYGERPVGTRMTDGVRWSGPPRWLNDGNLDDALEWIRADTSDETILALGQPWPYTFFSGRPSVLLPYRLTDEQLRRFLVEYRVSYVLHDSRDPQRREYGDQLRALEASGVRSFRVKNLQVFDTRPLWR